jgi:hypothetical protein
MRVRSGSRFCGGQVHRQNDSGEMRIEPQLVRASLLKGHSDKKDESKLLAGCGSGAFPQARLLPFHDSSVLCHRTARCNECCEVVDG